MMTGADGLGIMMPKDEPEEETTEVEDAAPKRATTPRDSGAQTSSPEAPVDASIADATVDVAVATVTETFTLGSSDCGGGHCGGGGNGRKEIGNLPTATKQCMDRGFARATDFTIGGQPGGRFCNWNGTSYECDTSCDSCNIMKTVMCVKP